MPQTVPNIVVEFEDKYGEKQTIHKTRHGLQIKRRESTVAIQLNKIAGPAVGAKIREARLARGWGMTQLCRLAGLATNYPKNRMYEIEKGSRKEGLRLGTLYALAIALDVPVSSLMPTKEEIVSASGIKAVSLGKQLQIPGKTVTAV